MLPAAVRSPAGGGTNGRALREAAAKTEDGTP